MAYWSVRRSSDHKEGTFRLHLVSKRIDDPSPPISLEPVAYRPSYFLSKRPAASSVFGINSEQKTTLMRSRRLCYLHLYSENVDLHSVMNLCVSRSANNQVSPVLGLHWHVLVFGNGQ